MLLSRCRPSLNMASRISRPLSRHDPRRNCRRRRRHSFMQVPWPFAAVALSQRLPVPNRARPAG